MNTLTSKTQYEADELFATLDRKTKSNPSGGKSQVTLHIQGLIQDLPTELVSSFKSTFGRKQACGSSGSCRCQ